MKKILWITAVISSILLFACSDDCAKGEDVKMIPIDGGGELRERPNASNTAVDQNNAENSLGELSEALTEALNMQSLLSSSNPSRGLVFTFKVDTTVNGQSGGKVKVLGELRWTSEVNYTASAKYEFYDWSKHGICWWGGNYSVDVVRNADGTKITYNGELQFNGKYSGTYYFRNWVVHIDNDDNATTSIEKLELKSGGITLTITDWIQ